MTSEIQPGYENINPKALLPEMQTVLSQAFRSLGYNPSHAIIRISDRPDLADFQCNGAFAIAKEARQRPSDIASDVAGALKDNPVFAEVSVAQPGFINLRPSAEALKQSVLFVDSDPKSGYKLPSNPLKAIIDYGGPNVAKPLHVGHLRPAVIGDCIRHLLRYEGYDILGDIHLGDWGLQMGMLITEIKRRTPDLPYFSEGDHSPYPAKSPVTVAELEEFYPIAAARCKANPADMEEARQATVELQQGRPGYKALWDHFIQISIDELERDYGLLGVQFDLWYGESRYQNMIPGIIDDLQARGVVVRSEGALVIHVVEETDKSQIPPFMVQKTDGAYLYGTTDLATLMERIQDMDRNWDMYIVDKRQSLHFEQLFRAVRKVFPGRKLRLNHAGNGTMNGPDGKPFKTREGGVLRLRSLLESAIDLAAQRIGEIQHEEGALSSEEIKELARMIGVGAVKYAELSHDRESDYIFEIEKMVNFEGRTGPYIQYASVRSKAILRKAEALGFKSGELLPPTDLERDLFLALAQLPNALDAATESLQPMVLCDQAFAVANAFAQFYGKCNIIREQDAALRESWLRLVQITQHQLEILLGILGIEVPERM